MRNFLKPRKLTSDSSIIPLLYFKLFGYRLNLKVWHWSSKFPLAFECRRVIPSTFVLNVPVGRYCELSLFIRKESTNA